MKKLYFLIISCFSFLIYAQNQDIFNYQWTITQIDWNGTSETNPTGVAFNVGFSTFTPTFVESKYFNVASITPIFSTNSDSFTKGVTNCSNANHCFCSFADYWGSNYQVSNDYDFKNCQFYGISPVGTVYNYSITTVGTTKILVVTDPITNNKIYYNGAILSTSDAKNPETLIYPNPVADVLHVDHFDGKHLLEIYSVEGKLIRTEKELNDGQIDVSDLKKGLYFLVIDKKETLKFIKN